MKEDHIILEKAKQPATPESAKQKPTKVALVSCGLGHINRGVEVSTARWFEALKKDKSLDVKLFSGGPYEGAQQVANLPRDLLLRTVFAPLIPFNRRRIWEFCYGLEQVSFAIFLGPKLLSWKPDVVWTKEAPFINVLLITRQMFNMKYRLIFANGCGFKPSTYAGFDYIQHLQHDSWLEALEFGIPEAKMSVLPNFIPTPKQDRTKEECRKHFGYTKDDWVITCTAAWNRYHKRIDYLIEDVAKIKDEKVKLLLCGHPEPDIDYLKNLADRLMPGRVQWHTLPAEQVPIALTAADVFVLPSLNEAFGGVLIEAMMLGLPTIVHRTAASRQLANLDLKTYDLSQPGNLAKYLSKLRASPPPAEQLIQLAEAVKQIFGEQNLCQQFAEMTRAAVSYRR